MSVPSSQSSPSSLVHLGPRIDNLHRLFLSGDDNGSGDLEGADRPPPSITNIDKAGMAEILSHLEDGTGDDDRTYVVMDVRGEDEIMMGTGTMSEKVRILPLPQIASMAAFELDEKSFESQFGFPKPDADEDTLVFTCKMGGRSRQAAQLAAMAGYRTIINYTGGADDWFGGEFVYT